MKYLVDFKNEISDAQIQSFIASFNGTIVKTFSQFDKTYVVDFQSTPTFDANIHSHLVQDENNPIQLLSTTIVSDGGIDMSTFPQIQVSTSAQQDWWKNFVLRKPEFEAATVAIPRLGENNVVYVLDSGININHPDFANKSVSFLHSFNNDFTDHNGHGTAIASVIVGNTCGITDATVKAVKIFEDNTPTLQSDMVAALDAIYQDFNNSPQEFAIVNCSWSIPKNAVIENVINRLIENGMYIVSAAGNSGIPIENVTPASMEKVITMGSYDQDLNPCDFSNYTGPVSTSLGQVNHGSLDGWAPGKDIYVATLNGSFGYMSGTSISAGIHSAVLAADLSLYNYENAGGDVDQLNYLGQNTTYNLDSQSKQFLFNVNLSLNRQDLLNLDEEKYQSSANRISSLIHRQSVPPEFKLRFSTAAHSNNKFNSIIFRPKLTKKLEILGELPAGISVRPNGTIFGIAPVVTSPTIQDVEMIAYDLNDQSYPFTYKIIILPSDYVIDLNNIDDPELKIQLQDSVGPCGSFGCSPTCIDNCFSFGNFCAYNLFFNPGLCNGSLKNGFQCGCSDSDKNLKKDITPLKDALTKLQSINGVSYTYNDTAKQIGLTDESIQIGVIAQELEQVYPELVKQNPNGFKSVAYDRLTAVLIEAVKELTERVNKLESSK